MYDSCNSISIEVYDGEAYTFLNGRYFISKATKKKKKI